MPTALITGITGQDGAYLAQLLLSKGYRVIGTSRDAEMTSFSNLTRLGIRNQVHTQSMALNDFRSVIQAIKRWEPDEIYNLAGQSSVALSFEQPVETLDSIASGTINLLEAVRMMNPAIRLYNASSSECFGNTGGTPADEETPFRPRSPYAVAKAAAFWATANYRDAYQLFTCSGLLFNHESPLRPERFVTQKIIAAACRIAKGSPDKLKLGLLDVERDWGWAPEYVEAMHLMLQQPTPGDFVIATGHTTSLKDFLVTAFAHFHLNWQDHVEFDATFARPSDLPRGAANPGKAREQLRWQAQHRMPDVVRLMIEARLNSPQ
jgi:GDPmannose 4,6-dehydratase